MLSMLMHIRSDWGRLSLRKKLFIAVLCLAAAAGGAVYFWSTRPAEPDSFTAPVPSLEQAVCEKVTREAGDCKRIVLFDRDANLVFAETGTGILPVLTNEEFTAVKTFIFPMMDFAEFKEERGDRGPIDWRVAANIDHDLSMIYGFAEDEAKTIVINSEGNIQPNRFYLRDHLSVWYVLVKKEAVQLPIEVTVYDANGQKIADGTED